MVTEFGAEANRDGRSRRRAPTPSSRTSSLPARRLRARSRGCSGAIYWALQEFRVRPDWDGGNPRPQPPLHQKGLITYDGVRKPAYFDVQRIYKATKQFRAAPRGSPGL